MRPTNPKTPPSVDAPGAPLRLFKVESGINALRPIAPRRVPSIYSVSALEQTSLHASNSYCILRPAAVRSFLAPAAKRKTKVGHIGRAVRLS
jgi:hypothetical protein